MGVLEDGELPSDHMGHSESDTEQVQSLGGILFRVAATASGSGSDPDTTDDGSSGDNSQSRKKRKRSN
jgi:hypothetical protein